MMKDDAKNSFLPKTDYAKMLRETRNIYDTVERCLDGELEYEELTDEEQLVHERVVWLHEGFKGDSSGFDRQELFSRYHNRFNRATATFNRDIQLVNKILARFRQSERELRRAGLIENAYKAIDIAMRSNDAEVLSRVNKNAWEIEGFKDESKGGGDAAHGEKLDQHVNLLVVDERTGDILQKLLDSNIGVFEYRTPIEEIIAHEKLALEEAEREKNRAHQKSG